MPNNKYKDYFFVDQNFKPCMSKDGINETPEYWMNFYPHESFVKFLGTVLISLAGEAKTVWMADSYGTGKSHAVLVLQKLLTDDSARVKKWLDDNKKRIPEEVCTRLWDQREKNPLVVYDCGADGITKPEQFLVRLQQSIIDAVKEKNGIIPIMGDLDIILNRIREEEAAFFKTRDSIQEELAHLSPNIKTADMLKKQLDNPDLVPGLVSDIVTVLEKRSIYLNLTLDNFRNWVDEILKANNLSKILFIWDEFSTYVDQNRNQLTTFQEVANLAQQGKFYLLPVTHMKLESYLAEGSESAKKVNDRFDFCPLKMPTQTALLLAGHALKVIGEQKETWELEKTKLWKAVKPIVTEYMAEKDDTCKSNPDIFKDVMPIHPMAAVILKFLATMAGSNQRSMFSFLKGDINHKEFQDFMAQGGPHELGKQFLTVDYLWSYFVERDDLGINPEISSIRMEYNRKSKVLDENEIRVFKAVLLYSLLDSITISSGNELIQPTIQNIEKCFSGDTGIVNVPDYLQRLQEKHCLSILGDRCHIFREESNSKDVEKEYKVILDNFKKYICDQEFENNEDNLTKSLSNKVKQGNNDKLHFVVRCSTPDKVPQNCQINKEQFSDKDNKVLVQFIVSPDLQQHQEAASIAQTLAYKHRDFRILFVVTPDIHFCTFKQNNWDDYAKQLAHAILANDKASKEAYYRQASIIFENWKERFFEPTQRLHIYKCSPNEEQSSCIEKDWETIIPFLRQYLKEKFEYFLDDLSEYNVSAFSENLKNLASWAEAGLTKNAIGAPKGVLLSFNNKGIEATQEWFDANPTHPLTQLRSLCKKKLDNALGGSGICSVSKILDDIVKPPYGLLYVPYTAFVMGFAMREWLDTSRRALQWTDKVQSDQLDAKILAKMIEDAIKVKGVGAIANEKFVCRITREEKVFIEAAPTMFGIEAEANINVSTILSKIADRLQQISNKAPLWILKDYIMGHQDPYSAQIIVNIIDNICKAMTIGKNDQQNTKSKLIKEAGTLIMNNEGVVQQIQKYIDTNTFNKAFKQYIDKAKPQLQDLAHKVGDENSQYCQTIKDRCADTTSWLWKPLDIDKELNIAFAQYQIIQLVQELIDQRAFISYSSANERLNKAFFTDNKISLDILAGDYPAIKDLRTRYDNINVGDDSFSDFVQSLTACKELVKAIFFDPKFSIQIATLKKIFVNQLQTLGDNNVEEIYHRLDVQQARLTEAVFRQTTSKVIDDYLKESVGTQLQTLWEKKTGSLTPIMWSKTHRLPVRILFNTQEEALEMVAIVQNPASFQADKLQATLQRLRETPISDNEKKLQNKFLKMVVPERYRKLEIVPQNLLEYLVQTVSNDPNVWLDNPQQLSEQIEAYIRNSYQEQFSEKAVNIARAFDANQAKKMLLEFIKKYPDIGLKILEDADGR